LRSDRPGKRLNDASTLGISLRHMLSIVHVLYLSRKSPFTHTEKENEGYGSGKTCLSAGWIIAY